MTIVRVYTGDDGESPTVCHQSVRRGGDRDWRWQRAAPATRLRAVSGGPHGPGSHDQNDWEPAAPDRPGAAVGLDSHRATTTTVGARPL